MKRSVIGFVLSFALAIALLVPTWATFPSSAMPWNLQLASFSKMEQATKDLEAYPFLTMIDENVQALSWRSWINDHSAQSSIFLIGSNRMLGKLVKLSAAVFGGIVLAFLVRVIVKFVWGKPRAYVALTGRLALLLLAAFVISFLLPVVICNHPAALVYSVPLLVGFIVASTGKTPEQAQASTQPAPIPHGASPFGPPPGYTPGAQGAYPGQGAYPAQGAYPGQGPYPSQGPYPGQGQYPGGQGGPQGPGA